MVLFSGVLFWESDSVFLGTGLLFLGMLPSGSHSSGEEVIKVSSSHTSRLHLDFIKLLRVAWRSAIGEDR